MNNNNNEIVIPSSSNEDNDEGNTSTSARANRNTNAANAIKLLAANNTIKKLLVQIATINNKQCEDINAILNENNRLEKTIAQTNDQLAKQIAAFKKMTCAFEKMQSVCKQLAQKLKTIEKEKEMKEKNLKELRQNVQTCLNDAEQQQQQQEPMAIDASEPLFDTQQVIESTFAEAKRIAHDANAIVAPTTAAAP